MKQFLIVVAVTIVILVTVGALNRTSEVFMLRNALSLGLALFMFVLVPVFLFYAYDRKQRRREEEEQEE